MATLRALRVLRVLRGSTAGSRFRLRTPHNRRKRADLIPQPARNPLKSETFFRILKVRSRDRNILNRSDVQSAGSSVFVSKLAGTECRYTLHCYEVSMNPKKCVVCLKVKGKRVCQIKAGTLICPHCCAQIRNPDCQGCFYYAQAQQYAATKAQTLKTQHFTMRVDPKVDQAVDQALAMIESGNRIGGESIVADLLKKHPDLHTVQFAMGVVLAMKGQYDESIEYFNKAVEIFPYFVEAWFNMGLSYQRQLKIGGAIRSFRKVIELGEPADDFVQHATSLVNEIERQLRENDGMTLDDYIKSNDKFDDAFSIMEKQHWQKAIDGFQAVIALNPKHPQTYGNMGICYAQLGRKEEALSALDKALEIDPSYEPALINRHIVASLEEGETLPNDHFKSVEYYKDYKLKKQSMLEKLSDIFRA